MSRALLVLDTPSQRQKAINWINNAKQGVRLEFKAPRRTDDQNAKMWAMLTEVAQQATHHTLKLTPDDWKLLFMDALKREVRMVPNLDGNGIVSLGRSSSDLSKQEMSDLIELIYEYGARNGVVFQNPNEPSESSGSPVLDDGSDGSPAQAPTVAADPITDPSQGGPVEAGGNEAASVASPASLPPAEAAEAEAMLQEVANPAPVVALKAEMISKLMAFAEERATWQSMEEHLAELDRLKATWAGFLPGHPALVTTVFRAVEKYIRDPKIGPTRVREYLENLKL